MAHTTPPRVAVIVPCYDDGATLEDAVASVLAQDEPVELIVVDDGSQDPETGAVMEALAARGVRVVRQANAGLSQARNAGLAATTARYVLPLDADDVLEPGAVASLAALLDEHPEVAAAWGWYQRFGDETTLQPTARTLDPWQITFQNDLPATAMLRRAALASTGGWRLAHGYEDWDMWMSLAERGWRGIGIDRVVYRYRRAGSRMLHDAASRHGELYGELERLHPDLFAARRRNWRRSQAPWGLRLVLPVLEVLPVSRDHKRLVGGLTGHLAARRGIRALARRIREQGRGTAPRPPRPRRS